MDKIMKTLHINYPENGIIFYTETITQKHFEI